jgi:transposase
MAFSKGEGEVVHESKTESAAHAIADELAKAPSCRRIVFETGRMAPILSLGLREPGFPVVCVESRQAYQALKSPATHETDRNDARGLAHLASTGFFKPVRLKSLPLMHSARGSLRAKTRRPAGDLGKPDSRTSGHVRAPLPRALTAAFVNQALKAK